MARWQWFEFFDKPKEEPRYKIVEVPEVRPSLKRDTELQESIATLASHPGFQAILNRLALQSAQLKTKLNFERHADMRAIDFLQAGIYWSNWLAQELRRATTKVPERRVDPFQEELNAFREIDAQIERVGATNEQQS